MEYLGSLAPVFFRSRQGFLLYTCSIYLLLDRAGTTTLFIWIPPYLPFTLLLSHSLSSQRLWEGMRSPLGDFFF